MHIKQQYNKIRHKVIMLTSTKRHKIAITLQNNIIRYKTTLYKVIILISTKQYIKTKRIVKYIQNRDILLQYNNIKR